LLKQYNKKKVTKSSDFSQQKARHKTKKISKKQAKNFKNPQVTT